jgi:hypothetical protein
MPDTVRKDWTGYKIPGTKAAYVTQVAHDIPFMAHLLCECRVEKHLSVVLVERIEDNLSDYVVWYYNHEDGGFHQGSYIDLQRKAYKEFSRRVELNLR